MHQGINSRALSARRKGALRAGPSTRSAAQGGLSAQDVIDSLPHMAAALDARGQLLAGNPRWQALFGAAPGNGSLRPLLRLLDADVRGQVLQAARTVATTGSTPALRVRLRQGRVPPLVELRVSRNADQDGHWVLQLAASSTPAENSLQSRFEQHDSMLAASVDCIKLLNPDGTVRHMNRSGCLALGVPVDEQAFGMPWLELLPPEIRRQGRRALAVAVTGRNARFAGKSVIAGSAPQYWDNLLTPMCDEAGQVSGILCVSRDVTAQREAELRLRQASEIDELTGLPNRRTFKQRLRSASARCRANGGHLGLMMIDLDHFKHVNDTLGHPAGDHLLRVLARRLDTLVGERGLVTRLGGDEFAVLLADIAGEQALLALAEQVSQLADSPVTYGGKVINGGMSIGCAVFPRDGRDAASLMRAADTALNDIKANGRGGVRMYCTRLQDIAEAAASQRLLARELVREGRVVPYYQPKVRLHNGGVVGYEALLRWQSVNGQVLEQGCELDEAFGDYELAVRLAEHMHNQVFADMARWGQDGLQVLPVAINASPVEFMRDDFAERLLERLRHFGVAPSLLEVEITEQVLADRGSAYVVRALRKLKQAGVRIALDDFGTGHSSLAHLGDYPIDCLKIDRSFIRRMQAEPAIRAIVAAVATLGPSLQLDLVAEGVEHEHQRLMLIEAGCLLGQGFLYSPAVSSADVAVRLAGG
jgi:diguanylate cyclase (GGDEF)-like protein